MRKIGTDMKEGNGVRVGREEEREKDVNEMRYRRKEMKG